MTLDDDDFTLFGLPQAQAQDRSAIDARWKALQDKIHPDRFVAQGAAAQRVAMQWAVRVNEAYQRLKDPLRRAAYLCELRGAPVEAERNTAMATAFLMKQMAWREALEEATDEPAVQALHDDVSAERERLLEQVRQELDERQDPAAAAATVRALMFVQRFAAEVDDRLDALAS